MNKNAPQIRCKCEACGRTQMAPIADLLAGNNRCRLRSFTRPDCTGTLNYYSDDWHDSILNACAMLRHLSREKFDNAKLGELVDTIADDVGAWAEGEQSPQEMGWVGADGRP